ncbi:uncharacterized protein LOC135486933 [Lineus longissimus]|uniref:uncharacterized protein LOC135486933 n=1 Tax=Lineus longissimus TaxID=88925 RepID=UPI00315D0893
MAERTLPDQRSASSEMANKVHIEIFTKLLKDVTDADLRVMKEYLTTAELLSRREVDEAVDMARLWDTMNRCGVISKMNYTKLKKMLDDLRLNFLEQYITEQEERFEKNCAAGVSVERPTQESTPDNLLRHSREEHSQNPPGPDKCCTLCYYREKKETAGHRECSDCDRLALCLDCGDAHEEKFQHCVVPLGSGKELCLKHADEPRLLKHRCVDCREFICDVCLVIGHDDHSTFKLSAAGKYALVNTPKAAEQMKLLFAALSPDFQAIASEASEILQEVTGMGTELIQEILLLYNEQMKSASRQRDRLVNDILADTDCMDIAASLYSQNSQQEIQSRSSQVIKLLKEKRDRFPLHVDFTKPEDISMGRLCQESFHAKLPCEEYESSGSFAPRKEAGPIDAKVKKKRLKEEYGICETPVAHAESPNSPPTYEELVSQGERPLHAIRRSNSKTESDAIRVRPKRHSSTKVRGIPSMNLYRGINGYELEDCGSTSWDFLPNFRFVFCLGLLSDTRQAFLTSKSVNPLQDLADSIIIFNSDGSSQNVITENVKNSRGMIINEEGEIVLLQTDPPCIRTLLGPEGEEGQSVMAIPHLENPTSIDVDEQDNYYIMHGLAAAKLAVLDDSGTLVTSLPMGDHRYVNYAGNNFIFTLSRTSISSYEWQGDKLCLNKTGEHGIKDFEIFGSCCNGFGDLFMIGGMTNTKKPREICLYQLLEEEDEWKLLRLDHGPAMKCDQEPSISYWNGHILIVYRESGKTCCSRRFKLSTIRRKSITVYDDDIVIRPAKEAGP